MTVWHMRGAECVSAWTTSRLPGSALENREELMIRALTFVSKSAEKPKTPEKVAKFVASLLTKSESPDLARKLLR